MLLTGIYQEIVEPSKQYADVIIPEGGQNEVRIDLVIQKIRSAESEVLYCCVRGEW